MNLQKNCKPSILTNLLFLVLLVCENGCDNEKLERLNIICLIDYSGTLSNDVVQNYAKIISHDIYGNLKYRDKITIIPIDEGAKTNATKIFTDDLTTQKEFSKQSDGLTHKQDSIKSRVLKYIEPKMDSLYDTIMIQKELRRKFTNETDIISAIQQASLLLEKNSDINKYNSINVLIFFSDMLNESDEFNLRTLNAKNDTQLDDILVKQASENHIPDLKNCIVFVNGRTGASNKVVDNTQYFWTQYFKKSNAGLKAYDYDCSAAITQFIQARQ